MTPTLPRGATVHGTDPPDHRLASVPHTAAPADAALNRIQWLSPEPAHTPVGEVDEQVTVRLLRQQVRRCLKTLTGAQPEAITLAYYGGYTYQQVARLLGARLPSVRSRMRDGLIQLRDCLSVEVSA
ncbi:sigma factor-like helix-turn-helix DNA-binding protein [Catellatospora citrea]|uniref:sigma factor-like helix-turn-helix DNA-binding protein n=1 Tax=Catellatospora citrea TaxID=53366 RepID=UPI0033F545D0